VTTPDQGFCVWLTGLSGSGKSTTATHLSGLLEAEQRIVSVLDGDQVRAHLSKGLGYSRTDRDANIRRIGFVAAEIVRHGGAVICATISPYREARNDCRALVAPGRFVEVYVNAPIHICEARDPKGLYAKARRGELTGFTGIDDPYEPPLTPELTLDTVDCSPAVNASRILQYLRVRGLVEIPARPRVDHTPAV
jgi:sulfate adenylyltransferase